MLIVNAFFAFMQKKLAFLQERIYYVNMKVKDIIKTKRLEMGLTLAEVAVAVGVSEGTVSRWESGEIKSMKSERITKLADVLKINPVLLTYSDIIDSVSDEDRDTIMGFLYNNTLAPKEDLSEAENALRLALNTFGYDLFKVNGEYKFIGNEGNGTISENDVKKMVESMFAAVEYEAKKIERRLWLDTIDTLTKPSKKD